MSDELDEVFDDIVTIRNNIEILKNVDIDTDELERDLKELRLEDVSILYQRYGPVIREVAGAVRELLDTAEDVGEYIVGAVRSDAVGRWYYYVVVSALIVAILVVLYSL